MAKRKLSNKTLEERAIALVRNERTKWETATAFITDRVSFKMRQLIRILRKNYYGIFDQAKDEFTQLEKIWYPITEINVEAVVKNIDLDQKDIMFKSKGPDGYEMTELTRAAVKDKLSRMYFGQKLDDFERMLCIDGTAVWKTWEEDGKMRVELVDLLNIYLDPTTPSIQEAYRFTERSLMFPDQIASMDWMNNKGIVPAEGIRRVDPLWGGNATAGSMVSNVKMVDVYEMWGMIPLSLITGLTEDDDTEVPGRLVVSGLDTPGKERCHLIERNLKVTAEGDALKPYEEAWFTRVPNRWYGRGVAEKLLTLQIYANIVFNVRINRSRIAQLGLFKIRKGAGITPQMLSRLPSNGAITLNSLDDLQQLEVQEVGATSYKDEDVINALSERLTNAFEVVTGESMPSSTPATNAVLQDRNAKSAFSVIKDGVAMFLTRWMDRHALPIIAKELTAGEIVRFAGDDDTFKGIVDRVVKYQAKEALDKAFAKGYLPSDQEIQMEVQNASNRMHKSDVFIELIEDIIANQYDTQVIVSNEEIDLAVTTQNLIGMLNYAPQYSEDIIKQVFDLMGLPIPKQNQQPQQQPGQQTPQQGGPQLGQPAPAFGPQGAGNPGLSAQQGQQAVTGANVAR